MTIYNWQLTDWPHFQYDLSSMYETLFSIAEKMGFIRGEFDHVAENLKTETIIDLMVEEAVKTSEIEGEYIQREDVWSSIKNKLGLNPTVVRVADKRALGVAELMLDVRHTFKESLTESKLFDWHHMLLSGSRNSNIRIGAWRVDEETMQIVSGFQGKQVVHFEAPPSKRVPQEMKQFIQWFNETSISFPPVRAAIAHLYFESIHPFDDGNGRIGRAIAEKALSQGFGYPVILSLSHAIEANKKAYYAALKTASRSNEITAWIQYFSHVISEAQIDVQKQIQFILKKAAFFAIYKDVLNERQLKVVHRMLKAGIKGFEGGMTAKKYMAITHTSKATATRDLQSMFENGVLRQIGSGRSVRYELNL